MKLSPHFDLSEFTVSQEAARNGIDNHPPEYALENLKRVAQWLEGVRILLGVPIIISSGYRCLELNTLVKGSAKSQHVLGQAVDFNAPGFGGPRHVVDRIIDAGMQYDQLILEYPPNGWVHASIIEHGGRKQALLIDKNGTTPLYT